MHGGIINNCDGYYKRVIYVASQKTEEEGLNLTITKLG